MTLHALCNVKYLPILGQDLYQAIENKTPGMQGGGFWSLEEELHFSPGELGIRGGTAPLKVLFEQDPCGELCEMQSPPKSQLLLPVKENLFTRSSTDGHSGYSHLLATMNSAAVNVGYKCLFQRLISVLSSICQR